MSWTYWAGVMIGSTGGCVVNWFILKWLIGREFKKFETPS